MGGEGGMKSLSCAATSQLVVQSDFATSHFAQGRNPDAITNLCNECWQQAPDSKAAEQLREKCAAFGVSLPEQYEARCEDEESDSCTASLTPSTPPIGSGDKKIA